MKAYRLFVSAASGAVFTAFNFTIYAVVLIYPFVGKPYWHLTIDAVIFIAFVVSMYGLIFGVPFGFILALLNPSPVVGAVLGIVGGALLLIYGANIPDGSLFADLSPRILVCFVLTSGLAGLLTSITTSRLCKLRTTKTGE